MDSDSLNHLREIRKLTNPSIKHSSYLKSYYQDNGGISHTIKIRDYQVIGVMNMLQSPKMILADDTGLGKTLQVLNTIGYIWLKEPEYLPIVVTTKSALFQWEAECRKFMQNMEPLTVSGEPHERNKGYLEFFSESDGKRVLLLTYDSLVRDIDSAIVKDKGVKADPKDRKLLKEAKKNEKIIKEGHDSLESALKDITDSGTFNTLEYVFGRTNGKSLSIPPDWSKKQEELLKEFIEQKKALKDIRNEIKKLNDKIAPPMRTEGILDLMTALKERNPNLKYMIALDEVHKIKNHKSQVHEKIKEISDICDRVIGMTATPVKNRLMEFYGIFRVINPSLFSKVGIFQNEYCVVKLQKIPGGRQVPIIVGYKNLDKFVEKIEPYFLSRKKQDVAKELPELISVEVQCELSDIQDDLYDMAENGVGNINDDDDFSDILSSLVMCQQAVDAPSLILDEEGKPFAGTSTKLDILIDMLEGDISGRKVIIFSRFEKMISVVDTELKKRNINYVRITGKETDPKYRQSAREKFQDPDSSINVILITMAGSESLNLQAAEHFIFLDLPWSYGDYLQLIGRMIRIGSNHYTVVAHHFLGKRKNGENTIDHHVLKALQSKKKLADKVSGDSLKDGLKLDSQDAVQDILQSFRSRGASSAHKPIVKHMQKKITIKRVINSKTLEKDVIESLEIDLSDI